MVGLVYLLVCLLRQLDIDGIRNRLWLMMFLATNTVGITARQRRGLIFVRRPHAQILQPHQRIGRAEMRIVNGHFERSF
jgi:hypothetical protein